MLNVFIINESRFSDSFIFTKMKNTGGMKFNCTLLDREEFPRELPDVVRGDAAMFVAEQAVGKYNGIIVAFTRANVAHEISCAVIDEYIDKRLLMSSPSVSRMTQEISLDLLKLHNLLPEGR